MEKTQPVRDLLNDIMTKLKELNDVNIIVGEKIIYNNTCVIPIAKIKCGFVSGGVDQKKERRGEPINPFGGAAGGTLSIIPIAFLAFCDNDVRILHLDDQTHTLEKIIDFIPSTFETIFKTIKKGQAYTVE